MEEHNYSVYVHTSPSNKKYVGVTKQDPKVRWNYGAGYNSNPYFHRAIKKYGWDNFTHEIVATGLTQYEALHMEMDLIQKYDSFHNGYNASYGGEGLPNRPLPIKARERSAAARSRHITQYTIDGEYVSTYKSIAEANRVTGVEAANINNCARGDRDYTGGYLWVYEGDAPIIPESMPSCYAYGKERFFGYRIPLADDFHSNVMKEIQEDKMVAVTQYDLDFNKVSDWESLIAAERTTGCHSSGIILCLKGERQTCGGFYWSYKDQPLQYIKPVDRSPLHTVYQFDKATKERVGIYKNLAEAEAKTGVSADLISGSCHGDRTAGGYYWMYEDEAYVIPETKIAGKRVRCIDTGEVFVNAREADSKLHISYKFISMCCHGKSKSAHGLRFEFADQEVAC